MRQEKNKCLQGEETEDEEYSQFIGLFDKNTGDYIKVDISSDEEHALDNISQPEKLKIQDEKLNGDYEYIINFILSSDITKMTTSIYINGKTEHYTTEKEGNNMSKEEQVKKIADIVKSFDDLVIVHSENELRALQREYQNRLNAENKTDIIEQSYIEDTNVYIRISEKDYYDIKSEIQHSHINIAANKVRTRDDKQGINIVVSKKDAPVVRDIIMKNNKQILQEVEGNTDWKDIRNSTNIYNNVSPSSLEKFQRENTGKYDYVAFKNGGVYTVYTDDNCDIPVDGEKRKTLADVERSVKDYKETNVSEKIDNKDKEKER